MSGPEMNLLNRNIICKTGKEYWLASPKYFFDNFAFMRSIDISGNVSSSGIPYSSPGVRPAISLIPRIEYVSGDGSMATPYIEKWIK